MARNRNRTSVDKDAIMYDCFLCGLTDARCCARRHCGKNRGGLRNPLKLVDAQEIEPWTSPV
jgi:hypothetical protein